MCGRVVAHCTWKNGEPLSFFESEEVGFGILPDKLLHFPYKLINLSNALLLCNFNLNNSQSLHDVLP